MTKEEFSSSKRDLLAEVGCLLSQNGFTSRAVQQSFRKKTDSGRLTLHLAFIDHSEDFDVTADIAVRFDAVEELVHVTSAHLREAEKSETSSLGCGLANLKRGAVQRWTVRSSTDVPGIAKSVYQEFIETGLPYLDKFSTLENALEVLRRDDSSAWLHSPIHSVRAKTALALAIVAGRDRAEIDALVEEKLAVSCVHQRSNEGILRDVRLDGSGGRESRRVDLKGGLLLQSVYRSRRW